MNTLDLEGAAAFLHMHPEELRTRAKRGLIPEPKPDGAGCFSRVTSLTSCARGIL